MTKDMIALLSAIVFFLSACSATTDIVADAGQIGAGATIAQDGNAGALKVPPSAHWPKGWDVPLTVAEGSDVMPGVQQRLTFKTTNNSEISFIKIGDKYVCRTCLSLNLPTEWHREKGK